MSWAALLADESEIELAAGDGQDVSSRASRTLYRLVRRWRSRRHRVVGARIAQMDQVAGVARMGWVARIAWLFRIDQVASSAEVAGIDRMAHLVHIARIG